jgi:hypothetical protein
MTKNQKAALSAVLMTQAGILEGIGITAVTHPEHAATLKEARKQGSTTDKGLDELPEDYRISPADDQTNAGRGCILFEGGHGGLGGRDGIMTLQEAYEQDTDIGVREGKHGLELYVCQTTYSGLNGELIGYTIGAPCDTLTFIIAGENHPQGVQPGGLVAWFPGPAAKPELENAGISLGDLVVKLN